jgi:hypothetical protein
MTGHTLPRSFGGLALRLLAVALIAMLALGPYGRLLFTKHL